MSVYMCIFFASNLPATDLMHVTLDLRLKRENKQIYLLANNCKVEACARGCVPVPSRYIVLLLVAPQSISEHINDNNYTT